MKKQARKKAEWEREDVPFEIRERTFQFAVKVIRLAHGAGGRMMADLSGGAERVG